MNLLTQIKSDLRANTGNRKGIFIVLWYRIAHWIYFHNSIIIRIIGFPVRKIYHIILKWQMGIEIPEQARIGKGLSVWHGQGLVINPGVIIGENVLLRHTTTIGNKYRGSGCPRIGNNVEVGAHTIIIGDIEIGDNVVIGAGTVVTKSIPADSIAYGNPLTIRNK